MKKKTLTRIGTSVLFQLLIYTGLTIAFILLGVWIFSTKSWKFLSIGTPLNISLHASDQADYSRLSELGNISPVKLSLIHEVIRDNNPDPTDVNKRISDVENSLKTPVPTVTPIDPDPNIEKSEITATSISAVNSQTLPAGQNTQQITSTPPALTITPLTATNTPFPTNTLPPPTNTLPAPTNTLPAPTNTLPPPTPTENTCGLISASYGATQDRQVRWILKNNSVSSPVISSINISWSASNSSLNKIRLKGSNIWAGNSPPPTASINSGWSGDPAKRTLPANSSSNLDLIFLNPAESSGYNITVSFSNGCSTSASR
jgi:hypothetical protein